MKKILSFFLISLCFLGCAHAIHNVYIKYDITSEYDEYKGLRTTKMNNNLIGNFSANKRIYLDAERLDFDTGETVFRILITYVGKDWIFIKKGNSLIFLIDKDKLTLNGDGSSAYRDVISGGTVIERAIYIIKYSTPLNTGLVNKNSGLFCQDHPVGVTYSENAFT